MQWIGCAFLVEFLKQDFSAVELDSVAVCGWQLNCQNLTIGDHRFEFLFDFQSIQPPRTRSRMDPVYSVAEFCGQLSKPLEKNCRLRGALASEMLNLQQMIGIKTGTKLVKNVPKCGVWG